MDKYSNQSLFMRFIDPHPSVVFVRGILFLIGEIVLLCFGHWKIALFLLLFPAFWLFVVFALMAFLI